MPRFAVAAAIACLSVPALAVAHPALPSPASSGELPSGQPAPTQPPPSETRPSPEATKEQRPQLAIGTNAPFMWPHSVAGTVAVGFKRHHAIRANVASYENNGAIGVLIGDVFFDGDGQDAIIKGRNLDVGVSYMLFPRRLWDGFFVEAGALVRNKHKDVTDESASPEIVITDTTTFAVRGHVGWSWLVADHVFVQVAVGASTGREIGRETTGSVLYPDRMTEMHDVSRTATSAEGFFRIGGAFDINP